MKIGDKVHTKNGFYGILLSIGEKTSWIENEYHGQFEFMNEIIVAGLVCCADNALMSIK